MSFASGKIAGMTMALDSLILAQLEPSKSHISMTLRNELESLSSRDAALDSNLVDPFQLRNLLSTYTVGDFKELGSRIQSLVQIQSGAQVVSAGIWILSVHFGVPLAIAVPAGLASSSAGKVYAYCSITFIVGLLWMKMRSASIERAFLAKLRESQKTLSSQLKEIQHSAVLKATLPKKRMLKSIEKSFL